VKDDSKTELDETDEIWTRFKDKHVAEARYSLSDEISKFAADNEKTSRVKSGEQLDIEEVMQVVRGMDKYKELTKKYTLHLQLTEDVISNFTQSGWKDLISLEQKIVSGVDEAGREMSNIDIIRGITKISKNLSREDHTRLLIQYLTCYELAEKDRYNMITSIQNDTFEQILENLPYVFPEFEDGKKLQRRVPKISDSQFSAYRKKLDDSNYDILRSIPKISQIAIDASNDDLNLEDFPYLGEEPDVPKRRNNKKAKLKNKKGDISDILQNPRIILFVIGGLSHHEIVSLQKIQDEGDVQCQIIHGGTSILRPNELLTMMKDIHKFTLKDNPFSKKDSSVMQRAKFEEEKI
jgi:hypothetical protein